MGLTNVHGSHGHTFAKGYITSSTVRKMTFSKEGNEYDVFVNVVGDEVRIPKRQGPSIPLENVWIKTVVAPYDFHSAWGDERKCEPEEVVSDSFMRNKGYTKLPYTASPEEIIQVIMADIERQI